jgi:hypothetical protein
VTIDTISRWETEIEGTEADCTIKNTSKVQPVVTSAKGRADGFVMD